MRIFPAVLLASALLGGLFVTGAHADNPTRIERLPGNPVIRPDMLPGRDGQNINGPSLIRAPSWLKNPLGRYYLYFAHHRGTYIRLAYADQLEGPWKIHRPGVLPLDSAPACRDHVASPDVIVDNDRQEIRLYFHCPARLTKGQKTYVALSPDGLAFTARSDVLGPFYLRVFQRAGWWYAIGKDGVLRRSVDGLTRFEQGHYAFPNNEQRQRHLAVLPDPETLWVYYSRIGDTPERILRGQLVFTPDWRNWMVTGPVEVLRPEHTWEGATLPARASTTGAAVAPENALRDPGIFIDSDARRYLVYSVAGESGLAIAELK